MADQGSARHVCEGSVGAAPFSLALPAHGHVRRSILGLLHRPIEQLVGLSALGRIYNQTRRMSGEESFIRRSLAAMNVSYDVAADDLARVPRSGPCIVVSNHPFGGLDGILLAAMLQTVRPDARVMANFLLARIPELHDVMIFVDPFGGPDAARRNVAGIRQCIEHVKAGGMLTIFPAGEVSHVDLKTRTVQDREWSPTVARIIRRTGAAVLPVFFGGSNGLLFSLAGMIHPALRTAMLPREFLRKRHTRVPVRVGTLQPFKKLSAFETDKEMMTYLRLRSYILQTRAPAAAEHAATVARTAEANMLPVAGAGDPAAIAAEIHGLPAEAMLLESGEYAVLAARAADIPLALREIGRLREVTFRGVHEGTGKPLDLDAYDDAYIHLLAWNKARDEIVGAYRLGPTDEILPRRGVKGLYTRSLFRFGEKVIDQLGPALELGRSFVRPEYQRAYAPLLLLWRGIGHYVARNPRYQVMFGPVSINRQYQGFSRQLIMTFLETTRLSALAAHVHAINPPRARPINPAHIRQFSRVVTDIDGVSDLVAEIEADGKGIPVMLKQYMKLSGKILGFNIDPDFGDVLDALMLVDLRDVPPRLLEKFAGESGTRDLLAYQRMHPR